MENNYFDYLGLNINIKDVPVDYCWSGYVKHKEEFECNNFYVWNNGKQKNIICSNEIAVALADYIANYYLKSEVISDMEGIFSPGIDQWFCLAWEQCCTCLEDLPEWVVDIFNILMDFNIIQRLHLGENTFYLIKDVDSEIDEPILTEINDSILAACTKRANDYWKEILDSEGEVFKPDCGVWGYRLYSNFISENCDVEVWAICKSIKGPDISFGITRRIKDFNEEDVSWVYEGISDCISENWYEFDEIAEKTKSDGLAYYIDNNIVPASEDEILKNVKIILEQEIGAYEIEFESDREDIDVEVYLTSKDISETVYDCICSNFAISYCIFYDLKEAGKINS